MQTLYNIYTNIYIRLRLIYNTPPPGKDFLSNTGTQWAHLDLTDALLYHLYTQSLLLTLTHALMAIKH